MLLGFGCAVAVPTEHDWVGPGDGSIDAAGTISWEAADAHSCSTLVIVTRENYDAARSCVRIDGDLIIRFDTDVTRFEFPHLIEITGKIGLQYEDLPHPITALRFPVLKRVGGAVELSATRIASLAWPELRMIGGSLMLDLSPELARFEARKLESIGGMLEFGSNPVLREIDLRSMQRVEGDVVVVFNDALENARFERIEGVGGMVYLDGLSMLERGDIEALWSAGDQSRPIGDVGCCQSMTDP
jgi:hypothetical protein